MPKYFILFILLLQTSIVFNQKLYCVTNLVGEFSGISYSKKHIKEEFRPSVPNIYGSWRIDIIYSEKKIKHRISLEESTLGKNFKIINKFKLPPNNGLGFDYVIFGTSINHLLLSYSIQNERTKDNGFLFRSRIRFNYSLGLGVSANRSKAYYREVYSNSEGGFATPFTYEAYNAVHYRNGIGVFLKGTAGFDFINKKGRRVICLGVFYNQGLKKMVYYDIHYQYGYFNDPQRQVDVSNQILKNKGTTFGFNIGVPITIKK